MQHPLHLSVIVPCYNPSGAWDLALAEKFKAFKILVGDLTDRVQLVVVNDGSSKNVGKEHFDRLKSLLPDVQIVDYPENRGKGYALRQGVQSAESDLYLVTDTDFPYTLDSMRSIVATLIEKGGVAAGNRDTAYYEKVPFSRKLLSLALRWMLRNVLRIPVTDSQCGLKGFDRAGREVFLQTTIDRFLFDLEFLMMTNGKVLVVPVPVELREGVVFSKVGWKILATEGRNFLQLFLKKLFGF